MRKAAASRGSATRLGAGWRSNAYRWSWEFIDLLFPPKCVGCGLLGIRWCAACMAKVERITGPMCRICGKPEPEAGLCQDCAEQRPSFRSQRSWSAYSHPARDAILRLKYGRDLALGQSLGHELVQVFRSTGWLVDLVVPVPLGKARLRERGYNQAEQIARPLAMELQLPLRPHDLIRVLDTRPQVGLSRRERTDNIRGAFLASAPGVSRKRVLLVDDVATTGSTLSACAAALLAAGASEVYGITVACVSPRHGLGDL